jgi:hypothetical protein
MPQIQVRRGITPAELARRVKGDCYYSKVTAGGLRRWLLAERLAVETDGRLWPTPRALELGGAIDELA